VSDLDIGEMSTVSPIVRQGWNSNKHVTRKSVSQRDNVLKNFLSVKTRDKTEYNPLIFSAKFLLLLHGKKIEN
jgi:hypothetical protein